MYLKLWLFGVVQDLNTNEGGVLQVTLEGIGLKFATRRVSCVVLQVKI